MFTSTRLSRSAYLGHWQSDLDRIVEVAHQHGHLSVPTCPDWTVYDLVDHLAGVYQHKVWVLELGKFPPKTWSEEATIERKKRDPLEQLQHWASELQDQLSIRADAAPAPTFMKDDLTVGFWWRRMALETVVHRSDVELSVGVPTPLDPALCRDGIDELLWFATAPWNDGDRTSWDGQQVVVDTGTHQWSVTLDASGFKTTQGDSGAGTRISGEPEPLLQWSAGRLLGGVERSGDAESIRLVEAHLSSF